MLFSNGQQSHYISDSMEAAYEALIPPDLAAM